MIVIIPQSGENLTHYVGINHKECVYSKRFNVHGMDGLGNVYTEDFYKGFWIEHIFDPNVTILIESYYYRL